MSLLQLCPYFNGVPLWTVSLFQWCSHFNSVPITTVSLLQLCPYCNCVPIATGSLFVTLWLVSWWLSRMGILVWKTRAWFLPRGRIDFWAGILRLSINHHPHLQTSGSGARWNLRIWEIWNIVKIVWNCYFCNLKKGLVHFQDMFEAYLFFVFIKDLAVSWAFDI